jgi:hypothetical protein
VWTRVIPYLDTRQRTPMLLPSKFLLNEPIHASVGHKLHCMLIFCVQVVCAPFFQSIAHVRALSLSHILTLSPCLSLSNSLTQGFTQNKNDY